jgi:hypothetical protein
VPPGAFANVQASAPPSAPARFLLFRPDEMESLARMLLNRDIFPSERIRQDNADAIELMEGIKAQYPQYADMDIVEGLLSNLIAEQAAASSNPIPPGQK